ncbi:putative type IV restriction endonuclease [Hymenobacter sp. UYAg731]
MSPSSPIAAIYQVLQHVQATAQINASIFRKNEAATRAALIDPVLRALGWDTANVQMVEPEKTLSNELRIDYLLNDPTGKPWVVVEAKCLDSSLDKYGYVGKILGYALTLNVQTVCITDGITWHLHTHLQHGKSEPIVFSLSEDDLLPAANELIRWLDAAQSGHGISTQQIAQAALTSPEPAAAPNKVAKPLPKLKKLKSESANFVEVSQLKSLDLPAGQKPKLLRLPNGSVKPITVWKDILLEVCRLVLKTNPNLSIPFPDKAGKSRFMFSNNKPEKGSSSLSTYKGKAVFIGTHYNASDCLANALYALQQLPPNQKTTTLAVSF